MTLRLAAALAAALGLAACAAAVPAEVPPAPSATVDVQILAFNDFHGHLEPPAGSNGRIRGMDAGGAEYLATHLARLRADNPHTVVVSAGDNVGATPLISAQFLDEPAIEALSAAGLDLSTVGNHEFDKGWRELLRLQRGGCHPARGCYPGPAFTGATFSYLSANVQVDTGSTLFPASAVRTFDGVSIAFIGLALAETPSLVFPGGVAGLTFLPEADAANAVAARLRQQGVHAVVVLIHQGGIVDSDDEDGCRTMRGGLMPVLDGLSRDIAVVVSGHTNRSYTCHIGDRLVTSAASYGRLITDIDLSIDRRTGQVVSKTARNIVVSRDVEPAPSVTAILDRYRPRAAEIGRRPVGSIAASVTRAVTAAGESAMGDVVADALLAVTRDPSRGGAQIAFVNQGGLRADLVHPGSQSAAMPHDVTYSDVFSLLPFGNTVVVRTITGEVLARVLEQQFDNPSPGLRTILQVSDGFSYRYDMTQPPGTRVDRGSMMLQGQPIRPDAHYRVAMSDFLWGGGDRFTAATESTDAAAQGIDIDVFLEFLARHSPVRPGPRDRITRVR